MALEKNRSTIGQILTVLTANSEILNLIKKKSYYKKISTSRE